MRQKTLMGSDTRGQKRATKGALILCPRAGDESFKIPVAGPREPQLRGHEIPGQDRGRDLAKMSKTWGTLQHPPLASIFMAAETNSGSEATFRGFACKAFSSSL